MTQGFTDLRIDRAHDDVQEGFWPSFTDIMTVVVMIFLIAMVVLLVRNMELVTQLRATMEAERIAAELARATGEERNTLSSKLHSTEERVQILQLEIMRLQEQDLRSEAQIAEQLRAISKLRNERDDLNQRTAQLVQLREQLESDVAKRQAQLDTALKEIDQRQLQINTSQRAITSLEEDLARTRGRVDEGQRSIEQLQETISAQRETIAEAQQQSQNVEHRYLTLAGDYDELKVKYDKLVRPARSSAGRHLIEVRYWKENGQYRISWREGDEGNFQGVSRARLEKVLARLNQEKENGLYVKVIFPENSGLSYNEAWQFTAHMHGNYDYYFKDEEEAVGDDTDNGDNAQPPAN